MQKDIRKQAAELADKYCRSKYAYFFPKIKEGFSERFSSWVVQLFQESLGSKEDGLPVKTTCSSENKNDLFQPVELKLEISDPVVSLIAEMYFFQTFIAFYSALKKINFVDQDYVEKYKDQMRCLEGKDSNSISTLDLGQVIKAVKENIALNHKFIEVVLYFYPDKKLTAKVNKIFCENFKERSIFVFVGSDWNHHSYQAAFGDKNTFYVFLQADSYETKFLPFLEKTLNGNVDTLKTISKATYLTLKNKSVLFSIPR